MPPGTSLEKTLATVEHDRTVGSAGGCDPAKQEQSSATPGQRFTDTEPVFGDEKGQIFVSLMPKTADLRDVDELIEDLRDVVSSVPGPLKVSFLRRKIGPPTLRAVSVKVRGDSIQQLAAASEEIEGILRGLPGVMDVSDDNTKGRMELRVQLNPDAIVRAGVSPADVVRVVRLYADGEVVASMQHEGEKLEVRVRAEPRALNDTRSYLDHPVGLPDGNEIALGKLLTATTQQTTSNIRHYDFRRAITVEADVDSTQTDALTANRAVQQYWTSNAARFPGVEIDLTGELDDIKESLGSIALLFLVGLGLIYLILGAQFVSYRQPFIVLAAVPMAFVGVVFGLLASGNPLSLYTLYGVVALAGVSANDAIVLISTANANLERGQSVARSIVSAARRRVVPIIITSVTTMAGLFSLAAGLAGKSLMWGPVATAIVWGLGFSTVLTLFLVPPIYVALSKPGSAEVCEIPLPPVLLDVEPSLWERLIVRLRRGSEPRDMLPVDAISNPEQRKRYQEGVAAAVAGDLEIAIRQFQRLADQEPKSLLFNLAVAQTLLRFIQKHGYDTGYMTRAQRYLSRRPSHQPGRGTLVHT